MANQINNQGIIPSTDVIQPTLTLKMTTVHYRLSKRQSLSTTTATVLFRTTITWTIKLNLLLKWLLGSNLSQDKYMLSKLNAWCWRISVFIILWCFTIPNHEWQVWKSFKSEGWTFSTWLVWGADYCAGNYPMLRSRQSEQSTGFMLSTASDIQPPLMQQQIATFPTSAFKKGTL